MSHEQNTKYIEEKADLAGEEVAVRGPGGVASEESGPALAGRRPGVPRRGRRTVAPEAVGGQPQLTPQQRLLVLDTWMRSGLPAGDYAPLVGVSKHTLYAWKARFEAEGPAGLMPQPRGPGRGSRLSDVTKRAVLLMKEQHPEWGVERIAALLARGPGLAASPGAVLRVLTEAGYQVEDRPTVPHPDKVRSFERAKPNELWQSDLFTFVLKRQNQRVYLVAFMDDHSRFVVSYGLHASQSAALVLEVFRAGIASYGAPTEVLTDNGSQYVTWRGTSQFAHECAKRGVKQIVATPRHPQTLGKIERFWGTLWRECLETAVFADLGEARLRIGHFIDHYNFQRPHQGVDHAVPADRFFAAAPAVRAAVAERVAANALELARGGVPKAPFYLTGNVAGQPFSVHAEGETVILTKGDRRAAIALDPRPEPPPVPQPAAVSDASVPPASAADAVVPAIPLADPNANPDPGESDAIAPPPLLRGWPTAPQAPSGAPSSPWTGAERQPPGGSALDRIQRLLDAGALDGIDGDAGEARS
jgi:transposase InsO family protein